MNNSFKKWDNLKLEYEQFFKSLKKGIFFSAVNKQPRKKITL